LGISRRHLATRFAQIDRGNRSQQGVSQNMSVPSTQDATLRRIERGEDNGVPFLRAVFPRIGWAEPQIIDLTYLLDLPHLADPFAEAFSEAYAIRASKTRSLASVALRTGFCAYLMQNNLASAGLADLTTERLNGFVKWLNQIDPASGHARWAVRSRQGYLVVVRILVSWLARRAPWTHQMPKDLCVPMFCWPGAKRQSKPTPVLTDDELHAVYRACFREVLETRKHVTEGIRLMTEACHGVPSRPKTYRDYADLGTCLAALAQAFPDTVPSYDRIREEYPFLFGAIRRTQGGILAVRAVLYPDGRLLVPFVLLLAIHTRYNPETLLNSNLEDCSIEERLGQRALVFRAYKGRSHSRQLSITPVEDEAPDNPASIVAFLREWTQRARSLAPPHLANRLLLFVPRQAHPTVTTYSNYSANGHSSTWRIGLRQFREDHHLKPFSLAQIRPTMLDLGTVLNSGDLRAAQALGNHRAMDTTYAHYVSDAQRQRNAERLGEVMALHTRWRETNGCVDPRERPHDADQGAATPGWNCLDPYDSPFSSGGKLCNGYGLCPVCPLAQLDLQSPYACAQAHNLLEAVRRARDTMAPQAWLARMAPIERRLSCFWLPKFSAAVHHRARQLDLPVLPVPE